MKREVNHLIKYYAMFDKGQKKRYKQSLETEGIGAMMTRRIANLSWMAGAIVFIPSNIRKTESTTRDQGLLG